MDSCKGLVAVAAAALVASAGCASTSAKTDPAQAPRASGIALHEMPMGAAQTNGAAPSASARMVCSTEIRRDVALTLALRSLAAGDVTWTKELYTCTYQTAGGALVLSVKDSPDTATGRGYFNTLKERLGPARPLVGLAAFGLPAYATEDGNVVFLKDGKTLTVDATELAPESIPDHQSPADVAYAIAADVIGCWSE